MDGTKKIELEDSTVEKRNGFSQNGVSSANVIQEHLTILDLSNKNLAAIDENVKLPTNLVELNLSHNKLRDVPVSVLNLENIKVLDLSHNCIQYFDDTPQFCHTIQSLTISNNDLHGPPYWVWSEAPTNLKEINLSCNVNITKSFHDGYYEELLGYKTLVTNIIIYNCKLTDYIDLLGTFPNAKSLVLGTSDSSLYSFNRLEEVPCSGMNKCCDIEYLNLSNTNVYTVDSSIQIFTNLKEIDISYNKLDSLPEEFCLLENLEICILSYNRIISLPANFCNLSKITILSVDCNELYILPSDILCKLPNIRRLDVYNNHLNEMPDGIEHLLEVDLAQNYFEEPNDDEYLEKRKLVRANIEYRYDGRKEEEDRSESDHSKDVTDDELWFSLTQDKDMEVRSSSPEDWDSDEYWVPHVSRHSGSLSAQSRWIYYVKKKMKEGNFCPMDAHPVPMAEQITYDRLLNPKVVYESDGQFDDFSSDDS
ncbi:leucine-rich repeat protein soc-2 homolog [Maniola hyperantus]|uniref:leucine-rich repeat protein soc-2 homolog n=1 Tax=Aphantopus hyperantus TaxID=2795564 RepID=UPI001569A03F|nr:leucine-rich repeat protein soc-2 homolog [Maniola hyperantus]